jgi:putative two-component system response regulator
MLSDTDTGQVMLPPMAAANSTRPPALDQGSPKNLGLPEEQAEMARMLVADQNPTVRKILRHLFASLGWETLEASNGPQALERARSRPTPHAILLELDLPEVNGYEVCRTLKSDDQFQLIPVIAITSLGSAEEKLRALEAGADDFLTKPINRAELTVRLRSLLRIHKFNQELIGAESVALALARAVAAKDGYAHSHLEKVANYAVALGKSLGLDAAELKIIKYGAILHNVGKIAIPDAVLEKTGPLSPREMAMFQQHPRIGCDICAPLKPLKPVLPIIRHHKEHWDGTGYPDGLRGDEIPLGAQIVGIVDVYTALTSNRPYRKAVSHDEAIASLREQVRHGWLNGDLVERFIGCLETSDRGSDSAPPAVPDPTTPS